MYIDDLEFFCFNKICENNLKYMIYVKYKVYIYNIDKRDEGVF